MNHKATTRKKAKVIGTQDYINTATVEHEEMQVISIEERDANFHKIWLTHLISGIELIGNQKIKLAFWIIENLDSENKLVMTQRTISEKTKISLQTVSKTIKALVECDFLIKINSGAYRVNPDMLWKGGKDARLNVLFQYTNEKQE